MKINLHIESLILEGLPVTAQEGPQLQAALENELACLLGRGGLFDELLSNNAVPRVRAGTLQLATQSAPANLGRGIARAVNEGIGKTKESRMTMTGAARRGPRGER